MPIYIVGPLWLTFSPMTAYELVSAHDTELYWTIAGHKAEHEDSNLVRAILARITQ